jgi:glycosyltransferase involved in cell wall biosynthesis
MHVITRLDQGGSAQNTLLTAILHDRTRFTPLVVAGRIGRWTMQGGDAAMQANLRRLEKAEVPCRALPALTRELHPFLDIKALNDLIALCRTVRPAIVHTHTSKAGVLGRLAGWIARVPVIVHTPHGHVFYGHFGKVRSELFKRIERLLARRTTALIALTEGERDEHLANHIGSASQFSVIPSGIDLDTFRAAASGGGLDRKELGCPDDAIIIGSVGWLTAVKGHRYLIEAVARLKKAFPRLHLVILGSGNLREELQALGERLGLGACLHLLGERPDVPAHLTAMDIFVLPSRNEGMGRALVEAMTAARPVVATRVGGVPAIVEDGITGLLVPPEDADALARALRRLLIRPDLARELGQAAARSIGERFGAAAMTQAVEAVYLRCLAAAGQT